MPTVYIHQLQLLVLHHTDYQIKVFYLVLVLLIHNKQFSTLCSKNFDRPPPLLQVQFPYRKREREREKERDMWMRSESRDMWMKRDGRPVPVVPTFTLVLREVIGLGRKGLELFTCPLQVSNNTSQRDGERVRDRGCQERECSISCVLSLSLSTRSLTHTHTHKHTHTLRSRKKEM